MNGRACPISTAARENRVRKQAGKADERAERWHAARSQSEGESARYAREKAASIDYSSIDKHIELIILMALVFRRISRFLCRAYAARWLVLRLRLRWIIHPGIFSSRVKQKNIMGAFYYGTCIYVNLYGTAALPTIRCLPFSTR